MMDYGKIKFINKVIIKFLLNSLFIFLVSCGGSADNQSVDNFLGDQINSEPTPVEQSISFVDKVFREAITDGGVINTALVITLSNAKFSGTDGDDFVAAGKVNVTNIPAGLTPVMTRTGETSLSFTLTGAATSHVVADDVTNVAVTFTDAAFTGGIVATQITGFTQSDIEVRFNLLQLSYDGTTLNETFANDGSINNVINISLGGDLFTGNNGDDFIADSKASVTNVPPGLTPSLIKSNDELVILSLTGNSITHTDLDDISNLTITFNDSAFTINPAANIDGYTRNDLIVNFINPAVLTYSGFIFNESSDNDGTISNTIPISLTNDTFVGTNGQDFIGAGHVTVSNIPAGLTASAIRNNLSQVEIILSGTATTHVDASDIANLTIEFSASAFTFNNDVSLVTNYLRNNITVDFDNPAVVSYSSSTLNETVQNIGGIATTVDIDLVDDTWTGSIGENFISTSKVSITNLPTGLIPIVTKTTANRVVLSFLGNATSHANANDISNLTVSFSDTAFTNNTNLATIVNPSKNDFVIDFIDPYVLSYSSTTFSEALSNDGSIANTLNITLAGTTFTGSNGENYVGTKALVSNVPTGLTATLIKQGPNSIDLSLSGNALTHINANDISNLTVQFLDTAFTSGEADGVNGSVTSNINVDFEDPANLTYSSTLFSENAANIGGVSTTRTITLDKDTFTGLNGSDFIADSKVIATNVPLGLTAVLNKDSDTQLTLSFTGAAASNANTDDVSNVTLTFNASAFTNATNASIVLNYIKNDIAIDFIDPYSLSFNTASLSEAPANDGSVTDTMIYTLSGTNFTGTNGDDFVAGSKVTFSNVPAGLTPVATKDSATQLTISFSGNATNNNAADSVSNITIQFEDTAFTSNEKDGVLGNLKSDISLSYDDPPEITYISSLFTENIANVGGSDSSVSITLTNKSFNGAPSDDFVVQGKAIVNNLPAGLTARILYISPTALSMDLTGEATNNDNIHDISNLEVIFNDSAFLGGNATQVTNNTKSDLSIDFNDPYTLSYAAGIFNEASSNNGAITETIVLTLAGTTFNGANGENFVASSKVSVNNTPAGLTMVATKNNATTMTLSFTGSATSNDNADDIANLEVIFEDNAFTSNAANGVTDSTRSNLQINFQDQASLAFSGTIFNEAVTNIGAIDNDLVITLSNDIFTGTNGEDFLATSKAVLTNLPIGLTATLVKNNDTQLTLSLGSNAALHANGNDISNLRLTFASSAFDFNTNAGSVVNSDRSDLEIDYLDPYQLNYMSTTLSESSANDGSLSNSLLINLVGTTFTGLNTSDLVADLKAEVNNVPAGLSATLIKNSDTQVELILSGNATTHLNASDIANLQVIFYDNAFTSNESDGVLNSTVSNLVVDFDDPPSLAWGHGQFNESLANIGEIDNTLTVTLTGDTYSGANGVFSPALYTVNNLPAGHSIAANKIDNNNIEFTISSSATNHENIHDISNLEIIFNNGAFTNTLVATNVVNHQKLDFIINYLDAYSLAYSTSTVSETWDNTGEITETIVITLTGTTFTGANGLFSATKYSQLNLPAGLSLSINKDSDTQLTMSFNSNATNHTNTDDISNFTINFNDNAFTSNQNAGVLNSSKNDIVIDFKDPVSLAYSDTTLNEDTANIGVISETVTVTLSNDSFTGANGEDYIATSKVIMANLPSGLTATMIKNSATQLTLTISGSADNHENADDISNLTFNFQTSAFTNSTNLGSITNSSRSDFIVDFLDAYSLALSTFTLNESLANDGSISNSIIYTLTGTTFTGVNGVFDPSKYTINNLPAGLTASFIKDSDTQLTLNIGSNATAHEDSNDISNLEIIFNNSAFVSNNAAGVINSTVSNIEMDFIPAPVLTFSHGEFDEGIENVGVISNTLIVTLANDTFSGANGVFNPANYTVNNLPAGLTVSANKDSNNQLTFTLGSSATAHENANDIANLEIIFNGSAFTNTVLNTNVLNYQKLDFIVDFIDAYTLSYSTSTFIESSDNNGSIPTSVNITLTGTTFTGVNGIFDAAKYSVVNLPAGLSVSLIKGSDTSLTLALFGNATSHENADDESSFTLSFNDTAFASNDRLGVTGFEKNDFIIDFNNAVSVAYSASTFNENIANVGTITETIGVTISEDTLTGSNGEDYIATSKVLVNNLPAGIVATMTKNTATTLTLALTGTATNHENFHDISNLEFIFNASAFTNSTSTAMIVNSTKSDFVIDFLNTYSLGWSGTNFVEAINNDGSIANDLTLTLSGTTFSGANGAFNASYFSTSNIPSGLNLSINKDSDTQLTLSLTGNAAAHTSASDIANMQVIFNDSAFASGESDGVLNSSRSDLVVDFRDPVAISYSAASFNEAIENIGEIDNTITLTLLNDTFTDANGIFSPTKYSVSNLPAGLSLAINKDNDTQLTVTLSGNATLHDDIHDISNLTLTFSDTAFTATPAAFIDNSSKADIGINFIAPYSLSYSGSTFNEALDNTGAISGSLTVTLSGTTFSGVNSDNFVLDSKVNVNNLPAGLVAVVERTSDTTAVITLTSNATSHVNADDISNLEFVFLDAAFTTNEANGVLNSTRSDIAINFDDPAALSYAGGTFNEDLSNDGSISSTITVTLINDTFTGALSSDLFGAGHITVNNLPAGLTLVATKQTASTVELSLAGNATLNENSHDVTNLEIEFQSSAFTNNTTASNVSNYLRDDLFINYRDAYTLSYDNSTFSESL
jgi:hypothetical protein